MDPLSRKQQTILTLVSLLIVALGQPALIWWCGVLASIVGYALFFRVLLCHQRWQTRFWLGAAWFAIVQLIQMSWFVSHPYYYIIAVYLFLAAAMGVQFGIIAVLITRERIARLGSIIAISGLWTLFEWSRLFFLSGFSWNAAGLSMASTTIGLQMASLWGVFGMSFWVMLVNLTAARKTYALWAVLAAVPYLYGGAQLFVHGHGMEKEDRSFRSLLVQTAFPLEEAMGLTSGQAMIAVAQGEWEKILALTKAHQGKPLDLIIFPEIVVPFAAYSWIYPYDVVQEAFREILGPESLKSLPMSVLPFAKTRDSKTYVNNAFWAQALANHFQAGVLIGLEDVEVDQEGKFDLYSSALYFVPRDAEQLVAGIPAQRYDKRVLLPMGEYIPFEWCRSIAATYGISGSFTAGREAKVFWSGKVPFGVSICYDETFGDLMRENKQCGAALITNLTNDGWYPTLPRQHYEHARLRTVESGIPLIRSCNTGITAAVDSLGRDIALLEGDGPGALKVDVPIYGYWTLYSIVGDFLIVAISSLSLLLFFKK